MADKRALARAGMIKHPFVRTEWNGIDVKSANKSWIPSQSILKWVCCAFREKDFHFSLTDWFCLRQPEIAAWSSMFKATLFANWTIGETPENLHLIWDAYSHAAWNGGIKTEHVDQFQTWRPPNFHFQIWIPHLNFDSTESISSEKCPTNDIKRD